MSILLLVKGAISWLTTTLDPVTVDTSCRFTGQLTMASSISSVEVDVFNVKGVEVTS